MTKSNSIAVLGECMLELSTTNSQTQRTQLPCQLSYGGDSLNTSIYLARLGSNVSYFSALGDDNLSQWMLTQWASEGVNCDHVAIHTDSVPGMYLIELDDGGERSFKYWRKNSPASQWLNDDAVRERVFAEMETFEYVYLSGISLAILPSATQHHILVFLKKYRKAGGKVIFDGNYRANLWANHQQAVDAFNQAYSNCDIALSTLDDEMAVFNESDADQVMRRLQSSGVQYVVLKMGESGCRYATENESGEVAAQKVSVVDTTSAGDSFNAGFLSSFVQEEPIIRCCNDGHGLAAQVIQYKGAIIPREKMV